MDKVTGLLGPRRRIAAALKQLREESGKHLDDIAGELLISTSKLSRLENAQGKPQLRDIRDLTRYYGIKGTKLAGSVRRWVAAAQEPGWWTDYDDELLKGRLDAHLAYEADATVERVYTLPFLPVLLQTPEYARAVYKDMEGRSEEEIEQLLDVREKRKDSLIGRADLPPLQLVAVTHESALLQEVGSPRIMRDQLDHLAERQDTSGVRLHVLPFSSRVAFSMTCMYAYFEYQDPENLGQDVVHIETHAGFWSVDDQETVARYRKAHENLVEAALNEDDSRAMIRTVRDSTRN